MKTKKIAISARPKMWMKASLVTLVVGCGSNQVSIGEKNLDASAGGATGTMDAPVMGGATSSSNTVPVGGASQVAGTTGAAGASAVAGNGGNSGLAGSSASGLVGGTSALAGIFSTGGKATGGASLLGGSIPSGGSKTGGSNGTAGTGGNGGTRCGGIAGLKCPSGSFCDYGMCVVTIADAMGTCVAQPEVCPANYAPVCGCDGKLYSNDCVRAGAGVGKASDGACGGAGGGAGAGGASASGGTGGTATGGTGGSSSSGKMCGGIAGKQCDSGEFCDYMAGTCGNADASGTCFDGTVVGACLAIWQPVCGCNGKTYGNDCERQVAGVSKKSDGECPNADGGVGDGAALCTASGGTVSTATCCQSTGDFPNLCLTGACGCAPASSHTVSTCNCSTGCYWPGVGCVGAPNTCTVGMNQTCNDNSLISSVHGRCLSDGRCACNEGYALLPSGKCQ